MFLGMDKSKLVELSFKDKIKICKKIFSTKYITKDYTINKILEDKE